MEIGEGLKWIIGTIVSILGLLGFGKLLELRHTRGNQLADRADEIHQTNQTKAIELDQFAFQKFAERLEKVEDELGDVRKELNSQMTQNARLEVENRHLKETNERQQREIAELLKRERILQDQVNTLTTTVTNLKIELSLMKTDKVIK